MTMSKTVGNFKEDIMIYYYKVFFQSFLERLRKLPVFSSSMVDDLTEIRTG
jgi:hypothetical protein